MSLHKLLIIMVPLALWGCKPDADEDGISDKDELEAGTNPNAIDTDGDGLTDFEEQAFGTNPLMVDSDSDLLTDGQEILLYGTNPLSADSDGDGYEDFDEIMTDHDPNDEDDVIYKNGWPFQRYKDDIKDRRAGKGMQLGKAFVRDSFKDTRGDMVDLWDFAYQGKPILIDVSASWCGPCKTYSLWLSGEDAALNEQYDELFPNVREAVDNGDAIWITFIGQNNDLENATKKDVQAWEEEFPHPNIPVLADTKEVIVEFIDLGFWPSMILLNEDMVAMAPADSAGGLKALSARLSE